MVTPCMWTDHVLLASESWGKRTEVASVWEGFKGSTEGRAVLLESSSGCSVWKTILQVTFVGTSADSGIRPLREV